MTSWLHVASPGATPEKCIPSCVPALVQARLLDAEQAQRDGGTASKEQVLAAKGALQKRRSQEGLQPAAAAAGGAAATAASPEAMAAEVRDLQHEFEAERQIMLATIREHEQSIAWRAAPTTSTANPPPPPPLPPPPPRHCHHDCRRHRGLLLAR